MEVMQGGWESAFFHLPEIKNLIIQEHWLEYKDESYLDEREKISLD